MKIISKAYNEIQYKLNLNNKMQNSILKKTKKMWTQNNESERSLKVIRNKYTNKHIRNRQILANQEGNSIKYENRMTLNDSMRKGKQNLEAAHSEIINQLRYQRVKKQEEQSRLFQKEREYRLTQYLKQESHSTTTDSFLKCSQITPFSLSGTQELQESVRKSQDQWFSTSFLREEQSGKKEKENIQFLKRKPVFQQMNRDKNVGKGIYTRQSIQDKLAELQTKIQKFQKMKKQIKSDLSASNNANFHLSLQTKSKSHSNSKPTALKPIYHQGELVIRNHAQCSLQARKWMLQSRVQIQTHTRQLVNHLCQQVVLDGQLRNGKLWFQNYSGEMKWAELQSALKQRDILLSPNSLKKEFEVCEEESNPFFSVKEEKGSISQLAAYYETAHKYWQKNLVRGVKRSVLARQNFDLGRIDLEHKGQIDLQDLVRFLNIESGNFYRKRDIYLVYRRLKVGKCLTFEGLLDVLAF